MAVFQGFGPVACEYRVMGFVDDILEIVRLVFFFLDIAGENFKSWRYVKKGA
jgi:hypothetical protein